MKVVPLATIPPIVSTKMRTKTYAVKTCATSRGSIKKPESNPNSTDTVSVDHTIQRQVSNVLGVKYDVVKDAATSLTQLGNSFKEPNNIGVPEPSEQPLEERMVENTEDNINMEENKIQDDQKKP